MKPGSFLIWIAFLILFLPLFFINRFLQKKILPRQSLLRLFAYMLLAFFLVFIYSFCIVWIISHLIGLSSK